MTRGLGLVLLALGGAACADAPVPSPWCTRETIEGAPAVWCRIPPAEVRHLTIVPGPSLRSAAQRAATAHRHLALAMNAGMFHADGTPVGLLIVDGPTRRGPLNASAGPADACRTANFYCAPNGVFSLEGDRAFVRATAAYAAHQARGAPPPRAATQSGPLLLRDRALARPFAPNGPRRLRNAVAVTEDGTVLLVLAERASFHGLALAALAWGARDALYLDGVVSQLYLGTGPVPASSSPFAGVIAFLRPRP